jgi:RNase adaptor protein for sRNA GlmZ degradation
MPRGPKGERRPADVNARAVMIAKIATGEIEDVRPTPESEGKNPAAVALGRMGGKARAVAIGKKRRREIARQAAEKRWKS